MASNFDYRNVYNDYQEANNPDMAKGGDTWAGDPAGYQKWLRDQFQQNYGMDSTHQLDLSQFMPNKADSLLYTSGSTDSHENQGVTDNHYGYGKEAEGAYALAQAKQYDPNAHMNNMDQLIFDRSKLPKWNGPSYESLAPYGGLTNLNTNNAKDRLLDPSKVINGGDYGNYTPSFNLKEAGNDQAGSGIMGQLQTYMPTVVKTIMSMAPGGGALMAYLSAMDATNGGSNIGHMNFGDMAKNMALSYGAGYIPGGQAALSMYNLSQQMKHYKKRS